MKRYTKLTGIREAGIIIAALIYMVPLFALVNVAIKPASSPTTAFEFDPNVTFSNFGDAWRQGALGSALMNSLAVTFCSVVISVLLASLAAYPLARITRRWAPWVYYLFIAGLLLPMQLALLPLYTTMRDVGLLGTLLSVILISAGGQLPFSVFLYTSFMRALPPDYEEAALIDGCGPIRSFFHIVLPLVNAATGTIVVLNAVGVWNEFFTPLIYLSGSGQATAPVAIYNFVGRYQANWPLVFASLCMTALPILIIYFVLQKYIIRGFAGGLKG